MDNRLLNSLSLELLTFLLAIFQLSYKDYLMWMKIFIHKGSYCIYTKFDTLIKYKFDAMCLHVALQKQTN